MTDAATACVIGGTSGIGLGVARALRGAGCPVTIAARGQERGRRVADEIGARFVAVDSTDAEQVAELVRTLEREGRVPTRLVVSGGGADLVSRPAARTPPADLPAAFALQFAGRVLPVLAFAPLMARCGYGKIVVISTVAGLAASRGQWLAGAMAAAAQHASRALAAEFAGAGVRVNVVALTLVSGSGFHQRLTSGALDPAVTAMLTKAADRLPWGPPRLSDAVAAVQRLLEPESDAVTGTVLALGGGLVW